MAWVLVETVSMFKIKYMVEVKDGDPPEWAMDDVVMGTAKEFSQQHLDETIFSHKLISEEEALELCDVDNEYFKSWSGDHKKEVFFTSLKDEE